ncbi:MAG: hypothetical protein DRP71_11615 [Verrucomicrobia bacterium]|nr:MAG: hypothetical protein DRP71_11615 [Verrucomicrobiota bacterium]
MQPFQASLSRKVVIITGFVAGILIAVAASAIASQRDMNQTARATLIVLPFAALGVGLLFRVRGYDLEDDHIRVRRIAFPVRLPIAALKSVEKAPELMNRSVRTFGNGGLFGFYGRFWKPGLGKFTAYVTNPENTVVLKSDDRMIALSPDQPRAFVQALREKLGRTTHP